MLRLFLTYSYFLGLKNLTIIRKCMEAAAKQGVMIDLEHMEYNHAEVYKMISQGDTEGVFQLESAGMTSFMRRLEPSCLEDIIAGIALYRPGPMDFIPQYIRNKQNPEKITYKHPLLEPILRETYGCIVYQEQVMEIVRALGGFSMGRADEVRRAMSKKKAEAMAKARQSFIYGECDEKGNVTLPGCKGNNIDEKIAQSIFDDMDAFAKYAFNKSHAAAYAVVAYQTAYLKCFYPVYFMAALISSSMDETEKVSLYVEKSRAMGIEILPPDINKSFSGFSVEGKNIRFGLGSVKNVGVAFMDKIAEERAKGGEFISFSDFAARMSGKELNKRGVEGIIAVGGFDSIVPERWRLLGGYESIIESAVAEKRNNIEGQMSLFGDVSGKEQHKEDNLPKMPKLPKRRILEMEKEWSGMYFSGHPLDDYRGVIDDAKYDRIGDIVASTADEGKYNDRQNVLVSGIVSSRRDKVTKTNALMSFIVLEDFTGSVECVIFPKLLGDFELVLQEGEVLEMSAHLDIREDSPTKLIGDRIQMMNKIEPSGKTLIITLLEGEEQKLDGLREIILSARGATPIVLNMDGKYVSVHPSLKVKITDETLKRIDDYLGWARTAVKME